jgi:hypothetical protein
MAPGTKGAGAVLGPGLPGQFGHFVRGKEIANLAQNVELGARWFVDCFFHPCCVAGLNCQANALFMPLLWDSCGLRVQLFSSPFPVAGSAFSAASIRLMGQPRVHRTFRPSHNDAHLLAVEFDKRVLFERGDDGGEMSLEEGFEIADANVAGAHEQQFPRLSVQQMRMIKIQVLRHDHTLLSKRKLVKDFVRGPVLRWQAAGMDRIVLRRI